MEKTLSELLDRRPNVNFIVNAGLYDLARDNRYLVPFMVYEHNEIRYGFVDKDENIVIPAKYDKVFDDFHNENDLVRVGKRFCINYGTDEKPRNYYYFSCGLINSKGEELIPCDKYESLYFALPQKLLVAHGSRLKEKGCTLLDVNGNQLIPMGEHTEIYHFVFGFARTQDAHGWGVIDEDGNIIIPSGEFEEIWNLDAQYPHIVVQRNGVRYTLPIEVLKKLQQELKATGAITTPVDQYLDYKQYLQRDFTRGTWMTFEE